LIIYETVLFGVADIATAFVSKSILIVSLQILNTYIFGIIAVEIVAITKSIIPTIIWISSNHYDYLCLYLME